MVDLDAEAARRRGEVAAAADIFAVTVERLEEHRVGEADDQQAAEILVAGGVLEQGESAGAVDRELDRAGAGERLEMVEVGVEQDARIADDRDLGGFGADALLDPGDLAIVEVAGVEAEVAAGVDFERGDAGGQHGRDRDHDPAPRLAGDIAGRHRLRLARAVGRGQAQPGGERAFLGDHAPWGGFGRFRTGSR